MVPSLQSKHQACHLTILGTENNCICYGNHNCLKKELGNEHPETSKPAHAEAFRNAKAKLRKPNKPTPKGPAEWTKP